MKLSNMSAPMVPKHHERVEVCESRPAYREGRLEKAVKVYTINQESRYLLVQGIPAVGGCQELVKLFAVYGIVEEYRILDDYPAEEFTEVYLFKFKKIQSARFAKKKLDDYSFFGGVLHVCYAPEYETVNETREKLQDRRKVIAAKLRQAAKTAEAAQGGISSEINYQYEDSDQTSISQTDQSQNVTQDHRVPPHHSLTSVPENVHEQSFDNRGFHHPVQEGDNSNVGFVNLELPPPPLNMRPPRHRHPPIHPNQYGYAWVPSSHATLPPNFDARNNSEVSELDSKVPNSRQENKEQDPKSIPTGKDILALKQNEKLVNGLLVREYKKPGKVPQFVPRQAVKKSNKTEMKESKPKTENNSVNKELRANAFTLGQSQGPTMPGKDEQKVKVHPSAQKSVNQSVKDIRKRISKFISEKVPQQKKSKPS